MAERDRIAHYFAPLSQEEPGAFNLTDDAALLESLVYTTDSVIEGIHVMPGSTAAQVARKLVRRNLSDLAAMGARPWRYLLNLHTPSSLPDVWFADFAATLREEQERFGMVLAGGDSTTGGNVVHATLTCIGRTDGTVLRRNNAQAGDDVYVSGTLGDAALGLHILKQNDFKVRGEHAAHLIDRYETPQPRLELGAKLHGIASACMDISDGLLSDAERMAQASGVQFALECELLPLSKAAQEAGVPALQAALHGGDDYELLFTAPVSAREALEEMGVTRIGTVRKGSGLLLDGKEVVSQGWEYR